jgi:hypothetical protein
LNSYGFAPTAPSRQRVYQFHHPGNRNLFCGRSGRIRTPDLRFWSLRYGVSFCASRYKTRTTRPTNTIDIVAKVSSRINP